MNLFFKRLSRNVSAMLALLIFSISGLAHADLLAEIQERGVIRVAVPQDFPPFGSVGTDLQPQGYDIDMANHIAEQLDVKVELIPVTSANRIPYLQTGRADLVISSLGKNEEREKAIDFTHAYAPFFLGVFGAAELEVAKPEDLAEQTVGVTRGAVEDMELEKVLPESAALQRFEDNSTTISAYLSGQVNLIATGNLVAAEIADRLPDNAPVTKFMLRDSPCFIGLKKDEEPLKTKLNEIIAKALTDDVLNEFSEKWLKAPLPENFGS